MQRSLRRAATALLLAGAFFSQGTWTLAGTTGGINGTVTDAQTKAPVAGATVTAISPSQSATATTDASGHYQFLSLSPDTYTVSVSQKGYQDVSNAGVVVFADATQVVNVTTTKLTTIATVTARGAGALVKPGTTADVYGINAQTQDKLSALGGGGSLNSAYSAISSVPGAFVPLNQTGYFQTVHIRGGDYDQVGYELDGVPVNRSFDNYPSGAASSLGQQEVQVYTGANPANSEGQGLAGYINQVIKTGTYPGFFTGQLGLGGPSYYHKASVEAGGATPNRMFSYYIGIGGYNQGFRYIDSGNGAGYNYLGSPIGQLPTPTSGAGSCTDPFTPYLSCYANGSVSPGGWALYPYYWGALSQIADRDVVANFHFAIPHKHDSGRDDIQLLWDSGYLQNQFYTSTNDAGMATWTALGGGSTTGILPAYSDGYQWTCASGQLLPANPQNCVSSYYFPSQTSQRQIGSVIPLDQRDTTLNDQEVVKLQYQKNFGSDAYLRVYGYTYYSDWLQNGPGGAFSSYVAPVSADYELNAHTRGFSAQFSKQFNAQNLVSLQGSYTTSSTLRDNNTQMFNAGGKRSRGTVLVNANDPMSGICYQDPGTAGAASEGSCDPSAPGGMRATFADWGSIAANATTPVAPTAGLTCGGGPCAYFVAENSLYATYNTVRPTFTAYSVTDEFRPNDRWLFNLGLRMDGFRFQGSDTGVNDPARQFWFNAWNQGHCINSVGQPYDKLTPTTQGGPGVNPSAACPAGWTAANMQNVSAQVESYNIVQPRLSGTYTMNPDTVLRFSAGKYVEPPNSAYEQYNTLQENLPYFLGTAFYKFGFTTPGHDVRPPVSYNYDLSLEKHLKGTDWALKLTPFLRKTQDQIQNFFLDQASGFVSGLNVGRQTSEGFELQVTKGDFTRNGWAGQFSFAYTNSYINYSKLSNGTYIVSGINNDIANFNQYTQACAAGGRLVGVKVGDVYACGGLNPGGVSPYAVPCFSEGPGTPAPGTPATPAACGSQNAFANPYFNMGGGQLLDPNANYPTYDIFPGPVGSSAQAFGAPYVASLALNYKHDKWSFTPTLQFQAGSRYGAPESVQGIDPLAGCLPLSGGTITGDPRYPNGAAAGSLPYDATTCNGLLNAIPDPVTGAFDNLGSFRQPNQIVGNLQISYEASPRVSLVGTFANLFNACYGGTKMPWTIDDRNICSYGTINNAGGFSPVGNVYNWTPAGQSPIQRWQQYPYGAYAGGVNVDGNSTKTPFNFFIEARIKL